VEEYVPFTCPYLPKLKQILLFTTPFRGKIIVDESKNCCSFLLLPVYIKTALHFYVTTGICKKCNAVFWIYRYQPNIAAHFFIKPV